MNRLLTDEQAAYLSQLYTGTEVPELHGTELLEDKVRSLRAANERIACKCAKWWDKAYERGKTIHRLERRLHKANRKHRALHRAMHEDTERMRGSLIKAAERLAQSIITPSPVEGSAYGAAWPRFADGAPVVIGDCVKGVMCDVEVASIVFRHDCVLLYDSQMFHYVKLDGGEYAQRPDGTRLALD